MANIKSFFEAGRKSEIIEEIKAEVVFSYQYYVLLFLSVIIATFGLIIGNTAIIIGAMILSPIIWPIIGLSLGTVISKKGVFLNSIVLLGISIVLTIFTAYVISSISPFTEPNAEVLLRTNPTFFDLIIALAAGIAAILVIAWPKYSNSIAGVAVAASVLPPICVTGIGLAQGSTKIAVGSFILFLTNMASIIFVGIAIFAFLGFYHKRDEEQVRKIEFGLIVAFIVILLLSFQLIFSLSKIIYEDTVRDQIRMTLETELHEISDDITVDAISVATFSRSQEALDIDANIKVPSDIQIDINQKNDIVEAISEEVDKEVNLELKILSILRVVTDIDQDTENDESDADKNAKIVQDIMTREMREISQDITIDSVTVSTKEESGIKRYTVNTTVRVPSTVSLASEDKENIMFELIQSLERPVVLNLNVINFSRL